MLAPKKLNRRKQHRPDVKGNATKSNYIAFGMYALQAMSGGWLDSKQIEAARRVLARYTHKGGKTWIRIFPHRPITTKGSQTTMGGGKGAPEFYVAVVKPGTIIFEMDGIPAKDAKDALVKAGDKFPVKTKFIVKK